MDTQDDNTQSLPNDPCTDLALSGKLHYVYAITCVNGFRLNKRLSLTEYKRIRLLPHGLWVMNYVSSTEQAAFDEKLVPTERAFEVWKSAKDHLPVIDWENQWKKHGMKGKLGQLEYFNLTLDTHEYLAPISEAGLLASLVTRSDSRRYLDIQKFTNYMRSLKCFCTVHVQDGRWTIPSKVADGVTFDYEELIEVRFYLDFDDPTQTLISTGYGKSRYSDEMDINVT